MKILQISSELNVGSVGRVSEQISDSILAEGWESYIVYGREARESKSKSYRIGNKKDLVVHGIYTRLTDKHGFASKNSTKHLVNFIDNVNPDIIHLHHLHGYYINIEILFNYLKNLNKPIVWTFHDCWSFTGHCAHYEYIGCEKWKIQCENCPQTKEYPKSLFDNSFKNYNDKKRIFNSIENLTIVPVSEWLGAETKKSFLSKNKICVIQNGIDVEKFNIQHNAAEIKEKLGITDDFLILGVASPFNKRKGFEYFIKLSTKLSSKYKIILVGLTPLQLKTLPSNIIGFERTESIKELAGFYSAADVFFNPTLEDTFPTTNLEAQACGTPVVTFRSGGSPETIDTTTGFTVEKGDITAAINCFAQIQQNGKAYYQQKCRKRAEQKFNKNINYLKYIDLYERLLK